MGEREGQGTAFEIRVVEAPALHVEQVEFLVLSVPGGADAEVAQLRTLVGRVPTLEHHVKLEGYSPGT